jgi:hypothetical protein
LTAFVHQAPRRSIPHRTYITIPNHLSPRSACAALQRHDTIFVDQRTTAPQGLSTNRCQCSICDSQPISAMSDAPGAKLPTANAPDSIASPSSTMHTETAAGHESPFVQPKTFLRPEPRAMESRPLTPLDKEQMQGLVSKSNATEGKLALMSSERAIHLSRKLGTDTLR